MNFRHTRILLLALCFNGHLEPACGAFVAHTSATDVAANAITKFFSQMQSGAITRQPGHTEKPEKQKSMDMINKFRAKICADMKVEHGVKFGKYPDCKTFMRTACKPGRDDRMDGDRREVSSNEGYCKIWFNDLAKHEKAAREEEEKAAREEEEEKEKASVPTKTAAGKPERKVQVDAGHGVADAPAAAPAGAPAGAPGGSYRPVQGDTVKIVSTDNTKESFPEGIGKDFVIEVDNHNDNHNDKSYQVAGGKWLHEEDVVLTKKKVIAEDEKWYYKNGGIDPDRFHMNGKLKLPTQGYYGQLVEHEDMETSIGDWQEEGDGPSHCEFCKTHPENGWCEKHVDACREPKKARAAATMIHQSMLALAVVFACVVIQQ